MAVNRDRSFHSVRVSDSEDLSQSGTGLLFFALAHSLDRFKHVLQNYCTERYSR